MFHAYMQEVKLVCAIAQTVSHQLLTSEHWVLCQGSSCGVNCGQTGKRAGFPLSVSSHTMFIYSQVTLHNHNK
jgi:hypothetical protein